MKYYSYEEFVHDTKQLVALCRGYEADTLLAVARGGLTLGHAFSQATNNRQLFTINSILYEGDQRGMKCEIFNTPELNRARKVLIIDDIVDSGQTLREIIEHLGRCFPHLEIKVASLFYKPTACIQPDFTVHEAKEWISFFWEDDFEMEKGN